MARNWVKDVDRGWKALIEAVRHLSVEKPRIVAGVVSGKHSSGLNMAELAAIHEFGAGVPKRSFIRDTIDRNAPKYAKAMAQAGAQVTSGNKAAVRMAMKRLALQVEGDIKQRIADGVPPPNAASTVAAKGSSTPLVDTGQLRASVTAEVRRGNKVES